MDEATRVEAFSGAASTRCHPMCPPLAQGHRERPGLVELGQVCKPQGCEGAPRGRAEGGGGSWAHFHPLPQQLPFPAGESV